MAYWLTVTLIVVAVLALLAVQDMLQMGHAIRRVYPLLGRLRYLVEMVGPELRQYIVTSDLDERPFSRSQRAWVYQASKQVDTSIGFGTQIDTWKPGAFEMTGMNSGKLSSLMAKSLPCAAVQTPRSRLEVMMSITSSSL